MSSHGSRHPGVHVPVAGEAGVRVLGRVALALEEPVGKPAGSGPASRTASASARRATASAARIEGTAVSLTLCVDTHPAGRLAAVVRAARSVHGADVGGDAVVLGARLGGPDEVLPGVGRALGVLVGALEADLVEAEDEALLLRGWV